MKASLKLINQLRSQLPPEAQDKLDELEGLAAEGEEDEAEAMEADADESGDELAMGDDEEMTEGDDFDTAVPPTSTSAPNAKAKKKSKPGYMA